MSTSAVIPAYNERRVSRFPMTLSSAALALNISPQRLSRHIRILQVPVSRAGYSVMIDAEGFARVKRGLKAKEIRRGRKKKAD